MFWMALYTFPVAWISLLFIGILKFNLSFLPIVILALVFNLTNTVGFTYAVEYLFLQASATHPMNSQNKSNMLLTLTPVQILTFRIAIQKESGPTNSAQAESTVSWANLVAAYWED
jgi:hypothetical protein